MPPIQEQESKEMQLDVNGPSICDQPMIDEIDETYRNAYPTHEPAKVSRMTP